MLLILATMFFLPPPHRITHGTKIGIMMAHKGNVVSCNASQESGERHGGDERGVLREMMFFPFHSLEGGSKERAPCKHLSIFVFFFFI